MQMLQTNKKKDVHNFEKLVKLASVIWITF